MAREFIDGFETNSMQLWTATTGAWASYAALTGAGGSYSWQNNDSTNYAYKDLTARDSYYFSLFFSNGQNAVAKAVIKFQSGTTILGVLRQLADNTVQFYRGDSANAVGSASTTTIGLSAVAQLEVYYLPKTDATGEVRVKINGVEEITVTSAQTANDSGQISRITIGTARYNKYDNIIVDSSAWVGATKVVGILPTGAGTTTQWDPSTGSNYACVDERGPSDTDYVSTNTTNEIDTYATGDLPAEATTIKAVAVCFRGNYAGAPTPTKVAAVVRSGGTDYAGTGVTVSTSFVGYQTIWEQNPNTSAAWTPTNVNDMEAGIKAVA